MPNTLRQLRHSGAAILAQSRRLLRDRAHVGTAPRDVRINDTFIVEYPKSGVTWLTFLLAKVNLQMSGIDRNPTFFSINDIIPDIHTATSLGAPLPFPGHRMIKSHSSYNPLYSKVLYLVRDPRDLMASYHAMYSKLGWYDGSLSEMIADPRHGIDAWCRHVEGWLTHTRSGVSFNVFRYEEMRADTAQMVRDIYRLLGFALPNAVIEAAVETADFKAMRDDEAFYLRRNLTLPQDFYFIRKGGKSHEGEMTLTLSQRILDRAGPLMERLGYNTD